MDEDGRSADLVIGNNVLAHVPDLNDFVRGLKIVLKPEGTIVLEFPHLINLVQKNQFDTIYHEHYFYFSLLVVIDLLDKHQLRVYDVDHLTTHGGSLRVYACHEACARYDLSYKVDDVVELENRLGLATLTFYENFGIRVQKTLDDLNEFLHHHKAQNRLVVGYGAAAKATVLLNACGATADLLPYVVDRSPYKQGKLLPGCGIPIADIKKIQEDRPDFILILPWNLRAEITEQLSFVSDWGGQFVTVIPELSVGSQVGTQNTLTIS